MANQSVYLPRTATGSLPSDVSAVRGLYIRAASLDRFGMAMLRLGLINVLIRIDGLKFEADGIVPLMANSPIMSFLYHYPAPEYPEHMNHMNKEGRVVPANQQ